jgi:hypothetical protein
VKKKIERTLRFYRAMRNDRNDGAICSTCTAQRRTATRMVVHMAVRHQRLPYGAHTPSTPHAFHVYEWDFPDGTRVVAYTPDGGDGRDPLRRAALVFGPGASASELIVHEDDVEAKELD